MILKVLSLLFLLFLSSCFLPWFSEPPGKGKKAERGYAACAPIIEHLSEYYKKNKKYPTQLSELLISIPTSKNNSNEIECKNYTVSKDKKNYTIMFVYTGPGVNRCLYSPDSNWICEGYF